MYSEKTFKNYIFWIQVKRIFVMILLSAIGAALGVLIGEILENTVKVTDYNNIIIVVSTLIFFVISILLTVGTGKEVQDGYWKIAVLRKLTVIQKSLEMNNDLLANSNKSIKEYKNLILNDESIKDINLNTEDDVEESIMSTKKVTKKAETVSKAPKKKPVKTIKKPEKV